MKSISASHAVLAKAKFGEADRYFDRKQPRLEADGSVHLDSEDGQVVTSADFQTLIQRVATLENTGDLWEMTRAAVRPKVTLMFHDLRLFVTETRIIWEQKKLIGPELRLVGHLRYPWISAVHFRPKQSLLNEPVLQLDFHEPFPAAGLGGWFHQVQLVFPKSFHPGGLAQTIVQQIARHHLRHGHPAVARERLEALANAALLPDPPKGDTAEYFMPIHVEYPFGAHYVGDTVAGRDWVVDASLTRGKDGTARTPPA
jgi:hypothetical protein